MGKNHKTENLICTKADCASDGIDDVLNVVGDALVQTDISSQPDMESSREADTKRDALIELCDDDIVFNVNVDEADKKPHASPTAVSKRSNPPIVPHPAVIKLKQRISVVKRRNSTPPHRQQKPALKGIRDDNFVLFSAATLARVKGDFSTRTYQNDEEVADALMDIHDLSRTANDETDVEALNGAMEAVLSMPPVSEPPVQQLVKGGKALKTAGILAVAVISAVVGAGLYSRFSSHAGRDDTAATEKNARIAELQKKSDELETVLASANSESVESLKRQLNETREELELLKSKQRQEREESTQKDNAQIDMASPSLGSKPRKSNTVPGERPATAERASSPPQEPSSNNTQRTDKDDELSYLLDTPTQPKAASNVAAPKPAVQSETDDLLLLPNSLSRDDVRIGMRRILAKVRRCGNGETASVTMDITIDTKGRVTNATALGPFADTPIGYCVSSVVKTAHFPKSQSGATVQYPFSLGLGENKGSVSSSTSSAADLDRLLTDQVTVTP